MLHLVDASYFIFRAYYSVTPEMADREGQPVNALYGFARFLGDLLEESRADHVAVAFDESLETSFRNRIYPAYKANREPAPVELKRQFAWCRELCSLMGLAQFGSGEYEADDIIGSLATRMRGHGHRCVLVTRDKDLAQLIRAGDHFWDYAGDRRLQYHEIEEHFGVQPERIPDFLALTGDSVDNVPGVPGVGPKTAAVLLRHFASLEELYDNLEAIATLPMRGAGSVADKLRRHRDTAYLARRLTRIACDMDIALEGPDALRRRRPDVVGIEALYDRVNFGPALRRQAQRLAREF